LIDVCLPARLFACMPACHAASKLAISYMRTWISDDIGDISKISASMISTRIPRILLLVHGCTCLSVSQPLFINSTPPDIMISMMFWHFCVTA